MARDVTGFRGVGARRRPRPLAAFQRDFRDSATVVAESVRPWIFFRGGQRIVILGMNDCFPYSADLRYALFLAKGFSFGVWLFSNHFFSSGILTYFTETEIL